MRKSGRLFIVLGVALALVAAALAIILLQGGRGAKEDDTPVEPPKMAVLVAAHDVPANTVLSSDDVQVTEVDPASVTPGAATAIGQVVGYAAAGSLKKGQYIVSANLVAAGLTFDVASGKRAVALPVDRINALGGLIRPDDRIDLVYSTRVVLTRVLPSQPVEVKDATAGYAKDDTLELGPPGTASNYPYPGEPGSRFIVQDNTEGSPVTKIVIQNVRVLRVIAGNTTVTQQQTATSVSNTSQSPPKANGTDAAATATPVADELPAADLLVLEVDPQQAEVIKFLQDNDGHYQVALRAKDDSETTTTAGVTYNQLIDQFGLPVPKSVRLPGGGQ